jgi:hypothetical protein
LKNFCKPFPSPPQAYLAFSPATLRSPALFFPSRGPARLTQHYGPARNRSCAAQLRSPPRGPLQPVSPPPPCVADRWGPGVIPDLRPGPEPEPPARAVPWLRAAVPAPARCSGTWARTSGPPFPFYSAPPHKNSQTLATPRRHRTLGAAASFDLLGRGFSADEGWCRSVAWR